MWQPPRPGRPEAAAAIWRWRERVPPVHASPLRRALSALRRLARATARAVGRLLTWLLLPPVFFLMVTPFGLLRRRGRRDRLGRRLEPARRTYWHTRDGDRPMDRPY